MRARRSLFIVVLSVIAVTAIAAAGCGGSTAESDDTLKAAFCNSMDIFRQSVDNMRAVGDDATVGEFTKAQTQVQLAWQELTQVGAKLEGEEIDNLKKTVFELDDAVKRLPGDLPLEEVKQMVEPQIKAVEDAWQALYEDYGCGT